MARKKQELGRFVSMIGRASLPSEGCDVYRAAMRALRNYVEENCAPGTRVEVCCQDGFQLYLATSASYRIAPDILLEDAVIRTEVEMPEGLGSALTPLGAAQVAAQVAAHNKKLNRSAGCSWSASVGPT